MHRLSVFLLVVLFACGGKKDAGPSCEQVVDHMLEVTKSQLMGHDAANFNQQKKAMVQQCEQRNMSAEMRTCLMAAQTISDIAKCRGNKTDVLERPRRPRPGSGSVKIAPPPQDPHGSAGSGSATAGSGSAKTGSGSATVGSAGSGSAKAGSGSAAGSAKSGSAR